MWFLKKAFGYINDFKQKNFSESAYPLYLDQLYSNLEKNVEKVLFTTKIGIKLYRTIKVNQICEVKAWSIDRWRKVKDYTKKSSDIRPICLFTVYERESDDSRIFRRIASFKQRCFDKRKLQQKINLIWPYFNLERIDWKTWFAFGIVYSSRSVHQKKQS